MTDQPIPEPDAAVLARLLAAGLDDVPGDPARIARLRAVAARLDHLGAVERAALANAVDAAGSDALERRFADLARTQLTPRRRRPLALGLALAAAATVLAAVVLWFSLDAPRPPEVDGDAPYRLNGDGDGELSWRAAGEDSLELTWNAGARRGAVWVVRVYDRDPAAGGSILAASRTLESPHWNPATDQTAEEAAVAAWPATVWIEVVEESPSGGLNDVVSEPLTR